MSQSILSKMVKSKLFGKSPVAGYLRLNKWLWNHLPPFVTILGPIRVYGNFLHGLVCLHANRRQFFGTFFLRNRPELELIRRLSNQKGKGETLRISVLGCSNGSEVYSILWTIRSARSDLNIIVHTVDISREVLEVARKGIYSFATPELVGEPIFERMSEEEMQEIFDRKGDQANVKPWIKEGISWHCGDVGDTAILSVLGPQDIVVANNFLCHMDPPDAEKCLRNIARLVSPGGYLFVSGIDLDIRTKVSRDLGWQPVRDLLEEIHDGDPVVRRDWPFEWWGLEPFNKRRHDWNVRYASVFQSSEKG